MSGLHPQYMLSKRFPVHAAIELQDLKSIATLLGNQKDARYHFDRKLTNNEVSIETVNNTFNIKTIIIQLQYLSSALTAGVHSPPSVLCPDHCQETLGGHRQGLHQAGGQCQRCGLHWPDTALLRHCSLSSEGDSSSSCRGR